MPYVHDLPAYENEPRTETSQRLDDRDDHAVVLALEQGAPLIRDLAPLLGLDHVMHLQKDGHPHQQCEAWHHHRINAP